MSLKQSCFKAQIKSDFKRLWWMSALATLAMFLFTTVPLIDHLSYRDFNDIYYYSYYSYGNGMSWLAHRLEGNYIIGLILGGALSLGLFSYLNGVSSVTFNHALPVKRSTLLAAHSLTALISIAIPIVFNSVICLSAVWKFDGVSDVLINMGIYLVYSVLIFTIFTFIGMLTGNTAAHGIFSVIFILLPLFFMAFALELCNSYLYGFVDNGLFEEVLGNYLYLLPDVIAGPKVLFYIVLIAVFYALALFAYNKRHLENYGEVIAFPKLKWLFKLLFGICSGVLGYYYCKAFWNIESILVMIIFGTLGVIIANMLSNKSFSLRGSKMAIIYNAIVVLLLFVIFRFDITGFETRVPDVDDVKSVTNLNMQYDGYVYGRIDETDGNERATRTEYFNMSFTDKKDIEMFVRFHEAKVSSENSYSVNDLSAGRISGLLHNVRLEYTLKNGMKLVRQYQLNDSDVETFLKPFIESEQYKKYRYPILDETEKKYTSVKVMRADDHSGDNSFGYFAGNSSVAENIILALKKDAMNLTFEQYIARYNATELYNVEVAYKVPATTKDRKLVWIEDEETYSVCFFDTNTLKALEESGCINDETKVSAENVEKIVVHGEGVYIHDDYYNTRYDGKMIYAEVEPTYSKYGNSKEFTSREDVELLFDYFTKREIINPFEVEKYAFFSYEIHYKNGDVSSYSMFDVPEKVPSLISFVGEYEIR